MNVTERLYSISKFAHLMRKLYVREQMSEEESEYLLGCALLLLKEYDETSERELFELAYSIVLRYAFLSNNYLSLIRI